MQLAANSQVIPATSNYYRLITVSHVVGRMLTNPEDLRFLESEDGKEKIVRVIVEGIRKYLTTPVVFHRVCPEPVSRSL